MKKLLVFAVVAASFASCSNGESDTKAVEGVTPDTTMTATPDTATVQPDTATVKVPTDTSTKK